MRQILGRRHYEKASVFSEKPYFVKNAYEVSVSNTTVRKGRKLMSDSCNSPGID